MEKLLRLNSGTVIILYMLADLICVGAGMGVPIFCILLGFPSGWYMTRRFSLGEQETRLIYKRIMKGSLVTTTFTFLVLAIVWLGAVLINIKTMADIPNFGHPYILFDPGTSFIGWLVLMVLLSPFLQLLTTVFAAFVTLSMIDRTSTVPPSGTDPASADKPVRIP